MSSQLKHAIFDELTGKLQSASSFHSAENILLEGCYNEEIISLLPFYMYYYHPQKWLFYSKCRKYYYINELNAAMVAALSHSSPRVDMNIKDFFYKAQASNPVVVNPSSLSFSLRTLTFWYTYKKLQRRTYGISDNEEYNSRVYLEKVQSVIQSYSKNLL